MNKLIMGDCLEKMKELDENSVDLIVTDPPYGYSFMNKDWDKVVVGVPIWKECLRVLKHGAFAFVMSAPRQDVLSRMITNLSDAGFNTGFTSMYWAYATGFPKAMNVAKTIDKKLGVKADTEEYEHPQRKNRSYTVPSGFGDVAERSIDGKLERAIATSPEAKKLDGSYAGFQPKPAVEVIIVAMKPIKEKTFVDQAMANGKCVTWFEDCRVPLQEDVDDKRLVEGGSWDTSKTAKDVYNGGYAGNRVSAPMKNVTKKDGTESRGWNNSKGYGRKTTNREARSDGSVFKSSGFKSENNNVAEASPAGRFPSNLLVSDCSLDLGKIVKGTKPHNITETKEAHANVKEKGWGYGRTENNFGNFGDDGDFSRYYDLDTWYSQFIITAKPSKSEKNKGLGDIEAKFQAGADYRPSNMEAALSGSSGKPYARYTKTQNVHPTVKPVKLMTYLITLGSREGDLVLDPFAGTGTTAIGSWIANREWLAIEKDPEYFKILTARVNDTTDQSKMSKFFQ